MCLFRVDKGSVMVRDFMICLLFLQGDIYNCLCGGVVLVYIFFVHRVYVVEDFA